jgi:hypothetical protein
MLAGVAHGGQSPISGATVTLMLPGTGGYGTAPAVLATATGLTGTDGSFSIDRTSYTCPAISGSVYILVTGGNAGSGPNTASVESALLGPCSALQQSTFIVVSEATTVAAAYTLAPFATLSTTATNIGTSTGNITGLNNAYGAANNLVDTTTGLARAANYLTNATLPNGEINTLANILAYCVNSNGATTSTDPCGKLFAAATPTGGTAPVSTFQAAIDIAKNPTNNTATLYGLVSGTGPFQTSLTTQPPDFGVGIIFQGASSTPNINKLGSVDIDANGNAWLAVDTYSSSTGTYGGDLLEISPAGAYVFGIAGVGGTGGAGLNGALLQDPLGIEVDAAGHIYAVSSANDAINEFKISDGSSVSTLTPSGLLLPYALALDTTNNLLWVTDNNNNNGVTLSGITTAGANISGSPFTLSSNGPIVGVAVDASASVWATTGGYTTNGNGAVAKFARGTGGTYTSASVNSGVNNFPGDLAIDANGSAWVDEDQGISEYTSAAGSLTRVGNYVVNAENSSNTTLVDGLNHIWVTEQNYGGASGNTQYTSTLTVVDSSGNSLMGTGVGISANNTVPADFSGPKGFAADASGNLWVAGYPSTNNAALLTEVIGVAAPVTVPLSVATATGKLGTRP